MRICFICFLVWSSNFISAQERIEIDCKVDMIANKVIETYQVSATNKIQFTLDQTQNLHSFTGHYWIGKRGYKLKKKKLDYQIDTRNPNNAITNYSFVFPRGKVPDRVIYKYVVVRNEVMYLAAFDFEPMKSYVLTIDVDSSCQVTYLVDDPITFEEQSPSIYPKYKFEMIAHQQTATTSKLQLMVHPKNRSPQDYFAHWYLNLINEEDQLSVASKLEIDRIVKTGSNKKEQAILLFEYVREQTNYYGQKTSLNIIRPQNVNEVLRSKFGDCKDLSLLLHAGYQYLGLDSYFGILNLSENITHPHFLASFDHAICVIKFDNEYIYLDGTDKKSQFGEINPILLDKKILLLSNNGLDSSIISPKL